jgi:hypothetical protein
VVCCAVAHCRQGGKLSALESLHGAIAMKAGRNDPCPCGSGKKYKHCCVNKSASVPILQKLLIASVLLVLAGGIVLVGQSILNYKPGPSGRVWSAEHQHWH